ncbi:MAG: RluA family pseudouridine synthase [Verrucomicrobiota bacterium]
MNYPPVKLSSPATKEFWEIPVLYEDADLLALCKPACLLSSPDRYDPLRPNLMRLLHDGITAGKPWARERGLTYLMNAHRLDFETSGVMLMAKSKPVLVELANLFGSLKPVKTYVALVHGQPVTATWTVDAALAMHPAKVGVMRIDRKQGKKSITEFETVEVFRGWTLVRCRPLTGRTHQIRVHLQCCGVPICGDKVYGGHPLNLSQLKEEYRLKGDKVERPLLSTVALHAERLELNHPVTQAPVVITAPWPKDLNVALKFLRRYATR